MCVSLDADGCCELKRMAEYAFWRLGIQSFWFSFFFTDDRDSRFEIVGKRRNEKGEHPSILCLSPPTYLTYLAIPESV